MQKVTGSMNQFVYDANGNVVADSLKHNYFVKYDWRNLIVELRRKQSNSGMGPGGTGITVFKTYYWYDEAGNRICKKSFQWIPTSGEPIEDVIEIIDEGDNPTGNWNLYETVYYVRDVAGKEIAIYNSNTIDQWNLYGLDQTGAIQSNGNKLFYLKDHLGSVRAIIDTTNTIVAAYDFDCWGYPLESRSYEALNQRYKFTGKERDKESASDGNGYDYFGVRYYDSRIGRWGGDKKGVPPDCSGRQTPLKIY